MAISAAGEAPGIDATERAVSRLRDPGPVAAARVLEDLANQGWKICAERKGVVTVTPPEAKEDRVAEKARVRQQELLKRNEQLLLPSVRRFIGAMEKPRIVNGIFVSIFSLMRDGEELASRLRVVADSSEANSSIFRSVIDPYVQIVRGQERCAQTGLRLVDIWRYFRHTWTNQYTSTPGRTMLMLVRDRAAPFHPVIGIAALGSAIIQIRERDEWIGWQPTDFLDKLTKSPTLRLARWLRARLDDGLDELYLDDLLEDDLYWPSLRYAPTEQAIERLTRESHSRRHDHHRFVRRSEFKAIADGTGWRERAESDLFRSKRCLALADLLRARKTLKPFLYPKPTVRGLERALADPRARKAISAVLRRAKAESVGTEIADLTVCGAIAPYNSILGGKLVAMLAVSPTAVRAYHERYGDYVSEIASSLAGRPIRRRSNLVFVGTTSLYGSGSSQYNRLRIPRQVLDGAGIEFRELGRSRSFGTSHLSNHSVRALVQVAEQGRTGIRVNSIFGEGVNPKLRKVRDGLDLLGWPSDGLLQHRRPRIIYGVSLVDNLLPYLLGLDREPRYMFRRTVRDDVQRITLWWYERWAAERIKSDEVLLGVAAHSLTRPVRHGARVLLPSSSEHPSGVD